MSDININNSNSLQNTNGINPEISYEKTEDDNSLFDNQANDVNGILEKFNQGDNLGDCGLIATLVSFKNSPKGREYIKQAIKHTDNGYSVYFKGTNKTYEITFDELEKALNAGYSQGETKEEKPDKDALLLEMAFEKACNEEHSGVMKFKHKVNDLLCLLPFYEDKYAGKKSIEAESPYYFMELLTGKNTKMVTNFLGKFRSTDMILNKLKNKDFIACVSFGGDKSGHVYSIKSIDDEYVTLINPWETNKDLKVKKEELHKAERIEYCVLD